MKETHNILPALASMAVPIADLHLDPANSRTHSDRNIQAIAASLAKLGQHRPAVVQKQGMVVRVGNGMVEAARKLGWTHVAAIVVDEGDVEATARGISDNKTSDLSFGFDDRILGKQFQALAAEGFDLTVTGFNVEEFQPLIDAAAFGDAHGGGTVDDPGASEPPREAVSRRGDLWILGTHRLLCGDSTKREDATVLLGTSRCDIMLVRPPPEKNASPYYLEKADDLAARKLP